MKAKRIFSRISVLTGASESAQEALRNEGYDLAHPPTLSDVTDLIGKTQRKIEDTMSVLQKRISPP